MIAGKTKIAQEKLTGRWCSLAIVLILSSISSLFLTSSADCGLHVYYVKGFFRPPIDGFMYAHLSNSIEPAGSKWLAVTTQKHEVDASTGSFFIDLSYDPTRTWRIPFGREICSGRPESVELLFSSLKGHEEYFNIQLNRDKIKLLDERTSGRQSTFLIDLNEIERPGSVDK